MSTTHTVTLEWVPGHRKIPGNERADQLGKRACTYLRTDALPLRTFAYMGRCTNKNLSEEVHNEWAQTPPRGAFGVADRIPPRRRPHTTRNIWQPDPSPHWTCVYRGILQQNKTLGANRKAAPQGQPYKRVPTTSHRARGTPSSTAP